MRKIAIFVGSRANYSSIKAVMRAVQNHPNLELQLIVGASAILDRFGAVVEVIRADGFEPVAKINMMIEGENLTTMAQSTGLGLLNLPPVFEHLQPDIVVTVGDRFETMATAVAAAYMNIPLAHTMGGEVTGTIDESIRHAVTKLAHLHFPANQESAERIIRMGEDPRHVYLVGCPRIDIVAEILADHDRAQLQNIIEREGVGGHIRLDEPFLLVNQHPVTTEFGQGERQIKATLDALLALQMPTIMLWPNIDAGSEDISRGMRKFREHVRHEHIRFYKNFPVETFVRLMKQAAVLVGNSSAAIREGAFIGVPAVNIGSRQAGRQRGPNVLDVDYDSHAIEAAIRQQLAHGHYEPAHIYGDGGAGERIAAILATCELQIQKQITY
jgi:UDP-hydrolysing UDP-N-acetyl-D-glucosamine 2-epimerase